MGDQLIAKILPALEKMQWPQEPYATEQGRQTFLVGMETLESYTGDPKTLSSALRTFQTGDSLPYAYAGVAFALLMASAENDGSYSQQGLEEAMRWLVQAQDAEPDILEINVAEALVYTYNGRTDDARLVLDFLLQQDPTNYFLLEAEIAYWKQLGDVEQTVYWSNKAADAAQTVPQRLRLRAKLADFYFQQNMLDEALQEYKSAVHFNNKNVALWHKISLIYWRQENYDEAEMSNQQALRLQKDYAPALKMQDALKKKKSEGSRFGRLFG
jgi:tetratricopeptide (TPR) repeat protein